MTRPTPRLVTAVVMGLVGLFGAVVIRRPEPVILAAPFLFTGLVGLVALRPPRVAIEVSATPARVLQGELVSVRVEVSASIPGRALVAVKPPPALATNSVDEHLATPLGEEVLLGPEPVVVEVEMTATDWGLIPGIEVDVVTTDRLGLTEHRRTVTTEPVRVLPTEASLNEVVAPRSLRSIAGAHRSSRRGDGIEFADSRPFVAGDRARDVNWRVSARRDELWVDDRHPERSGEVVLFLDSFTAVGDPVANTLRRAVELAQALTAAHIALNDRVGLVDLGGVLRWVKPGGGTMQLYRVVETLIETEWWASGADKTVDVLPARALPRRCLVVALSPLLDERGIRALTTLRARGFDVAVVEVVAAPFVDEPSTRTGRLAWRMWAIEQEAVRAELRSWGVAVGQWHDGEPLDPVLRSMGLFRDGVLRSAR